MMTKITPRTLILIVSGMGAALTALLVAIAVVGPVLGFGENEEFFLYQTMGISRRSAVKLGGTGFLLSAIPFMLYYGKRHIDPVLNWARAFSPGFLRLVSGRAMVLRAWRFVNLDWAAAALLLPAAIYVLIFSLIVLPGVPWIAPDSTTYLTFATYRTPLYPLFLRFLAIFADDPIILVAAPTFLGLGAVLFFAEMLQRLVRNILVSIPVGLTLFFNWQLVELSVFILTDYLFFTLLTFTFGLVLLALRRPSRTVLLALGIAAIIAVAIRPLGIVAAVIVPFLFIIHKQYWQRIIKFLAAPFLIGWLGLSVFNLVYYDYFGLARFSGFPLGANTIMLLKPDTPVEYPELRDRLIDFTSDFQKKYHAIEDIQERYTLLLNSTNPIIFGGAQVIYEFGIEKNMILYNDVSKTERLYAFVNNLSDLNKSLGQWPAQTTKHWVWLDKLMTKLARDAHLHNPSMLAEMTLTKLRFSWQSVLTQHGAPENFRSHSSLDLSDPNYGNKQHVRTKARDDFGIINVLAFNRISSWIYSAHNFVSVPIVIMLSIIVSLMLAIGQFARTRSIQPVVAAMAFLGVSLIAYHLLVSIAQIPLGRFIVVMYAASATLFFIPIAAIPHVFRLLNPRNKQDAVESDAA